MSPLLFSEIDESQRTIEIPKPKVNGGLYTGQQALGEWKSIYIKPQVEDMIKSQQMLTPHAKSLLPGGQRIGNNEQTTPGCLYYPETRLLCS